MLNKNLILLIASRLVSDTGTTMKVAVMPLFILDSGGSAAMIGVFSFFALVPALVVFPFAGVLGDRHNRKTIMYLTDYTSGALMLVLAFFALRGMLSLPLLFAGQVLTSVLNGLFDPASKGMLPHIVSRPNLARANSAVATFRTLSGMVGTVLGVLLYIQFGIATLFIINGIAFIASAVGEMFISYKHTASEAVSKFTDDLKAGFKFVVKSAVIRKFCLFMMTIYALIMPLFSVALPLFFRTSLNFSDVQYGYLQTIFIGGAFVGSIITGLMLGGKRKETTAIRGGLILMVIAVLAYAALTFPAALNLLGNGSTRYFVSLASAIGLLSIAAMFIVIPMQTSIQKNTPSEYMSRVSSLVGVIIRGGVPLGALIYGLILEQVPLHFAVAALAVLLAAVSTVFLLRLTPAK